MNSESDEERKPDQKKKSKADRFAFHNCFHGDAWTGLLGMPPEEVGVYWRLLLLQYIRRAGLSDADDAEIAQLCHLKLKEFRRIKAKLIARGRIEIDEENRIYFDARAMRELNKAGYFSEAQSARAKSRWKAPGATPPPRPRLVSSNLKPVDADTAEKLAQVVANSPLKSASSTCPSSFSLEENQEVSECRKDANHIHNQYNQPAAPDSPPAAQPPDGGGGQSERDKPVHARDRQRWLEQQAAALGVTAPGKDGGALDDAPANQNQAKPRARSNSTIRSADRTARRR